MPQDPEDIEPSVSCKEFPQCESRVKKEFAEKHDGWKHTDEGGWLCPFCNPDSDLSHKN